MTGTLRVQWTLIPAHAPRPWRHCPTCGISRAFSSSGKVRLNANGRKLDAWLIYRCTACDRTWLRPLVERAAVQHIPPADLEAMQHSAPAWVRRHEFDLAALGRDAERITFSDAWSVAKPARQGLPMTPGAVDLALRVPAPTGLRLERFLSRELPISRSRLRSAEARGGLVVDGAAGTALRKKVNGDMTITLLSGAFAAPEFSRICQAFYAD